MQLKIDISLKNEVRRELETHLFGFESMAFDDRETLTDTVCRDLKAVRDRDSKRKQDGMTASMFGDNEISVSDYILVRFANPSFNYKKVCLFHIHMADIAPRESVDMLKDLALLSVKDWNNLSEEARTFVSSEIKNKLRFILKNIDEKQFGLLDKTELVISAQDCIKVAMLICSSLNINIVTLLNNLTYKED